MKQKIGIDKIEITTKEYSIANLKNNQFGIDTSIRQGQGAPLQCYVDRLGNFIPAWKIYHNGLGNYSIDRRGLKISFNPSKISHPYNLVTTSDKKYHESFALIENECRKIGLNLNIKSCTPTRIDIAKNVEMNHDLQQYESAYRLLKGTRMKNQRYYEGGYLIKSTQSQIAFYDKKAELLANKINIDMIEKNLLRGEIRLLSTKSVCKKLNISTIENFNDFSENEVDDAYKTFLNTMIFPKQFESTQMIIDYGKESDILKECYSQYGQRYFVDTYLALRSIEKTIKDFKGIENFKKFLTDNIQFKSRNTITNIMNKIESKLQFSAKIDSQKNVLNDSRLINELRQKFAI